MLSPWKYISYLCTFMIGNSLSSNKSCEVKSKKRVLYVKIKLRLQFCPCKHKITSKSSPAFTCWCKKRPNPVARQQFLYQFFFHIDSTLNESHWRQSQDYSVLTCESFEYSVHTNHKRVENEAQSGELWSQRTFWSSRFDPVQRCLLLAGRRSKEIRELSLHTDNDDWLAAAG